MHPRGWSHNQGDGNRYITATSHVTITWLITQDYGPKVNFKKSKIKTSQFTGLPSYSQPIILMIRGKIECLKNFDPVELCNLEYTPERGSAIDPHADDEWVWGEHLLTLNLLSSTFLTFTHPTHTDIAVHMPLPRHSLLVVGGNARHTWLHSIRRKNITSRRIAMTLRELGNDFLPGGPKEEIGDNLIRIANTFDGKVVL